MTSSTDTSGGDRAAVRTRRILLAVALVIGGVGVAAGLRVGRAETRFLKPDRVVKVPDVPELSGLAWDAGRGILWAVGDRGDIATLDADGVVRRAARPERRDLEDVAVDGSGGVWILDEGAARRLRIDPETFAVLESRDLPRGAAWRRSDGYEGMTFAPDGVTVLLAHEREPAALVTVAPEADGEIADIRLVTGPSVSAVVALPDGRLLLVSRNVGIMIADATGEPLTPWRRIDARFLEGAAIVPGAGLWLAVDRDVGRLLFFAGLDDPERLIEACRDE